MVRQHHHLNSLEFEQTLGDTGEQRSLACCSPGSQSESESHSVVSDSLQPHGLYSPWNSPGKNTGIDSLSLLQGIFPTQGSNSGLPYGRQILYQLSPPGRPKNTGVGSLSLLQQIFSTQELNQDVLNCRWILYQLSFQGSLIPIISKINTAEDIGKIRSVIRKIK